MAHATLTWMNSEAGEPKRAEARRERYARVAALYSAWQRGDTAAFEELVAELHPYAYRIAWRLLGNVADAEDAVQETFWRLYRAGTSVRDAALVVAWVQRVMVNVCRSFRRRSVLRQEQLRIEESAPEMPHSGMDADRTLLLREALQAALGELTEKEREALVLRDMEGLEMDEVAKAMGVFQVTVRTHLSRGRLKVRRLLTEKGVHP